jgi:DNA repair protein RecO
MSHHIYKTRGYILESNPLGESNRLFSVFTHELGLIFVSAQNVRSVSSKLRPHLRPFALVELGLVRGRSGWRLTDAREIMYLYGVCKNNPEKMRVIAQAFSLLRRFVRGEEANADLFRLIESSIDFLIVSPLQDEYIRHFEAILVLSILRILGYVAHDESLSPFIVPSEWSADLVIQAGEYRAKMIKEINRSLLESQM